MQNYHGIFKLCKLMFDNRFRDVGWDWMDLRKTSDQNWLHGGFFINDHEITNTGPIEVSTTDYIDMSPFGNTLQFSPDFGLNRTEEEKSGR